MREIYNEGRVVGLSAYELYVRHTLNNFPETQVLTEREWLASTLSDGAAMILKIPSGTAAGVHDYDLPPNSTLCAAKTITASLFNGSVALDSTGTWATKVIDYGPLILNNDLSSPSTPSNVLTSSDTQLTTWDTSLTGRMREYLKIVDGVVFQPGEWFNSTSGSPKKDFNPDLNSTGTVRLRLSKALNNDVYILLMGFVNRQIVAGSSKIETGSTDTDRPQDGDFLGVQAYPWSCKIIFTVSNEILSMLENRAYSRELADGNSSKTVADKAIVDYESTNPASYYTSNFTDSPISLDVKSLNVVGTGASIIGAYQRTDKTSNNYTGANYPPVLYGAKVTGTGVQKMVPIDIASPGSVKIFTNQDLAKNYAKVIPNVYALYRDSKNVVSIVDPSTSNVVKVSTIVGVSKSGNYYQATASSRDADGNDKSIKTISLQDTSNNDLTTTGSSSTSRTDTTYIDTDVSSSGNWLDATNGLNWSTLLNALGLNRKIEFLGQALRRFRSNLPNIVSGDGGILNIKGTGASTIAGSLTVNGNTQFGDATSDTTTIKGKATVGNGLDVTGAISASGNISSSGNVSAAETLSGKNLTATQSISAGTTITAGGNISSDAAITSKGKITAGGGFESSGDAKISGNLNVTRNIECESLKGTSAEFVTSVDVGGKLTAGDIQSDTNVQAEMLLSSKGGVSTEGDIVTLADISATKDIDAGGNIWAKSTLGTNQNYIMLGSLRLYISTSAPTGSIPDGSIGIGW